MQLYLDSLSLRLPWTSFSRLNPGGVICTVSFELLAQSYVIKAEERMHQCYAVVPRPARWIVRVRRRSVGSNSEYRVRVHEVASEHRFSSAPFDGVAHV